MSWIIEKIKKTFKKRVVPTIAPIRLKMKSIIRWEQLNKKAFSQLDYNSEDDIISLFYTCTLSDQVHVSLDEFRKVLTEVSTKKMIQEFEKQTSLLSQFQAVPKKKEGEGSESSDPVYIKEIVAKLVMNGLEVHFALNEMELCDLPIFLEAYDQNIKDSLESTRLWTFIQVSPHLSKEVKSPKDLYQFPWEITNNIPTEAELAKAARDYQMFMQTGLKK